MLEVLVSSFFYETCDQKALENEVKRGKMNPLVLFDYVYYLLFTGSSRLPTHKFF